jgi:DNA repair protein RadC
VADTVLDDLAPPAAPRSKPSGRKREDLAWSLARLLPGERARSLEAALKLVESGDLLDLSRSSARRLALVGGLPLSEARRLAAALSLARRLERFARAPRERLHSAADVARLLRPLVRGLERESFHVLLLDGRHGLKRRELVSMGSLSSSLVHPREVFRAAVREAAAAVICAHNHPSGDPEPSVEDFEITRRLKQSGDVLGIPLLDHVVLGEGAHVSLRERGGW